MSERKNRRRLTRREFLQESARLAAGACTTAAVGSTAISYLMAQPNQAHANTKPPVTYPKLTGEKIQPPENGCYVGFRRVPIPGGHIPPEQKIETWLSYYEKHLGLLPHNLVLYEIPWNRGFPGRFAVPLGRKGVKPFIYIITQSVDLNMVKNIKTEEEFAQLTKQKISVEDIATGKADQDFARFAQGGKRYGENFGGFFISTMEEMNGDWWHWGAQPDSFKKAWRRIWKIFEDEGANKYATWVWEPYCPESTRRGRVDDPKKYYPGDDCVDWIGLSAFSRDIDPQSATAPFEVLQSDTMQEMLKTYPSKPIYQSEFAKTRSTLQARWVKEAYEYIRKTPDLKAICYRDNKTMHLNDDQTLTEESLAIVRELLKDPYFIKGGK